MGNRVPLTAYQSFKEEWEKCTRCELKDDRKNVVIAKGKIPCDVLFIGEAPGPSEDILGKPFKGPAGQLLDKIVTNALPAHLRLAYTNMVCCIPKDDDGAKVSQPPLDALIECKPRLERFVEICKPKLIVCVGKLPKKWLERGYKDNVKVAKDIEIVDIDHPSYILREGAAGLNMLCRRAEAIISSAAYDVFNKVES